MNSQNQSGFTLVETIITVSVVSILLAVVANFSISAFGQSAIETARANLLGESQITMDRVIADIRLSAGAIQNNRWPDANNGDGEYAWESTASTIVLATAVVDGANNVIFADPARYISEKNDVIYFVRDNVLYKRVLASPVAGNAGQTTCPSTSATTSCPADRALLRNVTSFTAKYYNGDEQEVSAVDARSIELNIQTSIRKFSRNITSDYTTRAVFRND